MIGKLHQGQLLFSFLGEARLTVKLNESSDCPSVSVSRAWNLRDGLLG